MPSSSQKFDVAVIGGGPAGSTVATLLSQSGLDVAVFERECFPRFRVGESLLPANLPIFDRLGCHETLQQAGFMVKPGATFYDEYEGRGRRTITFSDIPLQPAFAYNVVRAQFDTLLLQHASRAGATVYPQHVVEKTDVHPHHVTVHIRNPHGTQDSVQAKLVVDASGRATFLGGRFGTRKPLPNLGKVALFAHFKHTRRDPAIPAGNIRIYLVENGWLWWIPFADGTDSIGCVLHARAAKQREGSIDALFETTLAATPSLAQGLQGAQRLTSVHSAANFSYRISPVAIDRMVAIGDAAGFVDPVFSTGVFIAMHSAELAAVAIQQAFQQQDFSARRFRRYEIQLRRGLAPFLAFIQRFYEPAFLDLLFSPRPPWRLYQTVLWVLSGAVFDSQPLWLRTNLMLLFRSVAARRALRWISGRPSKSRRSA
ncbi:MAG: NAD(P)/FAD-dependent oxidoreductase [bacterium]|nr:NAD(P)/FAD-dependent oxidoreductase [bacterium]